ncbi:MAG: class D beta-lactamase [Polyangiaceae bacterium]|nr:class D beta-lactamase [Polyangiaceae bacterium]
MLRRSLLLGSAALVAGCATNDRTTASDASKAIPASDPPPSARTPFAEKFDTIRPLFAENGCFAMREPSGPVHRTDPERCAKPRRPYSTFKIANALVGLETGIVAGADSPLEWDQAAYPTQSWWPEDWSKPHTLATGMAVSAVPYFRTLARTIGKERMKAGLQHLGYPPCAPQCREEDLAPIDSFWLDGSLRISADEQLAFVDRIAAGKLPTKTEHRDAIRKALLREERDGRKLFAKTGTGSREDQKLATFADRVPHVAWLVGWVEDGTTTYPFAAWVEGPSAEEAWDERSRRVYGALEKLGLFSRAPT